MSDIPKVEPVKIIGRPIEDGHALIAAFVQRATGLAVLDGTIHLVDGDDTLAVIYSPALAEEFAAFMNKRRHS